MSKRILVLRLQPNDSGKTTLCKALIYGFKATGVGLVPFKPHSGIGYWSQFDTFQTNLATGRLLSRDIMDLEAAADSKIPLEVLNPVNRHHIAHGESVTITMGDMRNYYNSAKKVIGLIENQFEA